MAKFEEEKIITALHPEKAEIGKKYWYADELITLKIDVESNTSDTLILKKIYNDNRDYPFEGVDYYQFLYPYEEPLKQRMTNRQFSEWCNRGNGQWKWKDVSQCHIEYSYPEENDNAEVDKTIHIRPWDSSEWIEPTVDIYKRDCKGGK